MAANFEQFDALRETTSTEGLDDYLVDGSPGGQFRAFSTKLTAGYVGIFFVRDGTSLGDATAWERFIGTYTAGEITRDTLLDSSTGSWIDWPEGTRIVEQGPAPTRVAKAGTGCSVTNDPATGEQVINATGAVSSVFGRTGAVVAVGGDYTATQITFTPAGTIGSTNVQAALEEIAGDVAGLASGLTYKGTWNANTNSPTLASSTGTRGDYYIVGTAGATNLDGVTDWKVGDWLMFNGSTWQKIDNTDLVTSVFGQVGAVVENQYRLNLLSEDTSPDAANDFVMTWDNSASVVKKVKLSNFTGGLTMEQIEDNFAAGVFVAGYGMKLAYDDSLNTFTWHKRSLIHTDTPADTVTIDLDQDVGEDHNLTLDRAHTDIDVDNEAVGDKWWITITQDSTGDRTWALLFDVEWQDGYEPAQQLVPGKSIFLEFEVLSVRGGSGIPPVMKGWCETRQLPKSATGSIGESGGASVASWSMNETSGTRVDDPGTADLTPTGTVGHATGLIGEAASFDGSGNDYLTAAHQSAIAGGERDFSVSVWFNANTLGSGGNTSFLVVKGASHVTLNHAYALFVNQANVGCWIGRASGTMAAYSTTHAVSTGEWHHLVLVVDRSSDELRLYFDGVVVRTADISSVTLADEGEDLHFAGYASLSGWLWYDGLIDQSDFFDYALTDGHVASLWNSGAGQTYPQSIAETTTVDCSICDAETITLTGDGIHEIDFTNLEPFKPITLPVLNDGATGTIEFVDVDFGDDDPPDLPADGKFDLYQITPVSRTKLTGKQIGTGFTP